jgi:hypothetical protein
MTPTIEKHRVIAENAPLFLKWIRERGGIAVWGCLDLSDPGKTWSSPIYMEDGTPHPKPHYYATTEPIRIITDPAEILVDVPKEVKRFHIAIRMGAQGFKVKLTDASTRKVRAAVEKAGEGAWYQFDYETQEAVIYKPEGSITLDQWKS